MPNDNVKVSSLEDTKEFESSSTSPGEYKEPISDCTPPRLCKLITQMLTVEDLRELNEEQHLQ